MEKRGVAKPLPKFLCEFCGSGYSEVGKLIDHKKRHHKIRTFECEVCDTMFSDHARLSEHKKNVHGLPMLCVKCHHESPNLTKLRAHLKRCKGTWRQETEELPVLAEASLNEDSSTQESPEFICSAGEVSASHVLRRKVEDWDSMDSEIQSCHSETGKEISSSVCPDMAAGFDVTGNFNFDMRDEKPVVFPAMDTTRSEQTRRRRSRSPSVEIIGELHPAVTSSVGQLKTPKLEPPSSPESESASESIESLLSWMSQRGAPQPVIKIMPLELQDNLPEGIKQRLFMNGMARVLRSRKTVPDASSASAQEKKKKNEASKTRGKRNTEIKVYCVCRGPSKRRGYKYMVECGKCEEWYHLRCIGIPDTESEYNRLKNEKGGWYCAGPLFRSCRKEQANFNPQSTEDQSKSKNTEGRSVLDEGAGMPMVEAEDDNPPASRETAGGTNQNHAARNRRRNSRQRPRSSGRKPQRQSVRNTTTGGPIGRGSNQAEQTEVDECSSAAAGQNLRVAEPERVLSQRDEGAGVPIEISPSVLSLEPDRNGENLPRAGGSQDRAKDTSPEVIFLSELKYATNSDEGISVGGDSGVDADSDRGSVGDMRMDLSTWNVRRVVDFVKSVPDCEKYAMRFEKERVDGKALLLLEVAHFKSFMEMPLGPAVKLWNEIKAMKSRSAAHY